MLGGSPAPTCEMGHLKATGPSQALGAGQGRGRRHRAGQFLTSPIQDRNGKYKTSSSAGEGKS